MTSLVSFRAKEDLGKGSHAANLCVVEMAYLVRTLRPAYMQKGFKFHISRKQMRLGLLSFANNFYYFLKLTRANCCV